MSQRMLLRLFKIITRKGVIWGGKEKMLAGKFAQQSQEKEEWRGWHQKGGVFCRNKGNQRGSQDPAFKQAQSAGAGEAVMHFLGSRKRKFAGAQERVRVKQRDSPRRAN